MKGFCKEFFSFANYINLWFTPGFTKVVKILKRMIEY